MFFRRGLSHDRWLQLKIWIFTVGAILALLGMALGNDWLILIAAITLVGGILLRLLDRGQEEPEEE